MLGCHLKLGITTIPVHIFINSLILIILLFITDVKSILAADMSTNKQYKRKSKICEWVCHTVLAVAMMIQARFILATLQFGTPLTDSSGLH
jgi:hypothetical protein